MQREIDVKNLRACEAKLQAQEKKFNTQQGTVIKSHTHQLPPKGKVRKMISDSAKIIKGKIEDLVKDQVLSPKPWLTSKRPTRCS